MEIPEPLLDAMHAARKVAVLTGAGISAESGIPTFREAQTGLWARYRPEDLATPAAFRNNPKRVWEWYQWRRELVRGAEPNPGHHALARLEELVPEFTLITQNVDGYHRLAGSMDVVELHGNILRTVCFDNRHVIDAWEDGEVPPKCPICGSLLRPDVVWFGEKLPREALERAIQASSECDIFFSIGTSGVVEPAASLPWIALQNDASLVEINPDSTPVTQHADHVLPHSAGELLPELVANLS